MLSYFAARSAQERKAALLQLERGSRSRLLRDGVCRVLSAILLPEESWSDPAAFQLFDPRAQGAGPTYNAPFCVIAASPRKNHWLELSKAFRDCVGKLIQADLPAMLYAPDWAEKEVLTHANQNKGIDAKDVEAKHRICGGCLDFFSTNREKLSRRSPFTQSRRSTLRSRCHL